MYQDEATSHYKYGAKAGTAASDKACTASKSGATVTNYKCGGKDDDKKSVDLVTMMLSSVKHWSQGAVQLCCGKSDAFQPDSLGDVADTKMGGKLTIGRYTDAECKTASTKEVPFKEKNLITSNLVEIPVDSTKCLDMGIAMDGGHMQIQTCNSKKVLMAFFHDSACSFAYQYYQSDLDNCRKIGHDHRRLDGHSPNNNATQGNVTHTDTYEKMTCGGGAKVEKAKLVTTIKAKLSPPSGATAAEKTTVKGVYETASCDAFKDTVKDTTGAEVTCGFTWSGAWVTRRRLAAHRRMSSDDGVSSQFTVTAPAASIAAAEQTLKTAAASGGALSPIKFSETITKKLKEDPAAQSLVANMTITTEAPVTSAPIAVIPEPTTPGGGSSTSTSGAFTVVLGFTSAILSAILSVAALVF